MSMSMSTNAPILGRIDPEPVEILRLLNSFSTNMAASIVYSKTQVRFVHIYYGLREVSFSFCLVKIADLSFSSDI